MSATNPMETQQHAREWFPYLNRELSWLEFVGRVLALAEDGCLPLLERVKFLAISSQNLDHFFQVRVAGLKTQIEAQVNATPPDGQTASEQLRLIRPQVAELIKRQDTVISKEILPALAEADVRICDWEELSESDRRTATSLFEERIFPVLTPLSVDPAHPFPYISNLSLNLALVVCDPTTGTPRFARVKVPRLFPRFVALTEQEFIPIEQIIENHIEKLFPGMEIVSCAPFRVTRDADLAIEESGADDLMHAVESGLRRRHHKNAATRLETLGTTPSSVRDLLIAEFDLEDDDVYLSNSLLDLSAFWQLHALDRPDLKDPPFVPLAPLRIAGANAGGATRGIFAAMSEGDILVQHPYESFSASIEAFLAEAAADPHVLAIKHTLYRTSGPENPIMRTLIQAAESGKQVVTLVELTARFDEEANIEWARALEKAGVHVVYGVDGLKAHGKITLVVRNEPSGIRRYGHVGTGNYNPQTARVYEDVGLLTCDPDICADLTDLFNYITGYSRQQRFRKLLVAPMTLRGGLLEMIHREMDQPDGRIVMKANSLADPELIQALYAASQRGVEIDLIIRGICCLRPGTSAVSENIRVRSIVGPFLEHSRIFRFGSDARGPRYFIGSSDLMKRNLDSRVEVMTPVEDPQLVERLREILDACLADDQLAWELESSGTWRRVPGSNGLNAQLHLLELAALRNQGGTRDT